MDKRGNQKLISAILKTIGQLLLKSSEPEEPKTAMEQYADFYAEKKKEEKTPRDFRYIVVKPKMKDKLVLQALEGITKEKEQVSKQKEGITKDRAQLEDQQKSFSRAKIEIGGK